MKINQKTLASLTAIGLLSSGIQAHAWLFYPGQASLSDNARQRLRAIQEFAQLGSGYQLAMRDMEIRGVGNLLGVEQSGQMETIGFDLYMEMLQESLAEIQGQDIPAVEDTQVDIEMLDEEQRVLLLVGQWLMDALTAAAAFGTWPTQKQWYHYSSWECPPFVSLGHASFPSWP